MSKDQKGDTDNVVYIRADLDPVVQEAANMPDLILDTDDITDRRLQRDLKELANLLVDGTQEVGLEGDR